MNLLRSCHLVLCIVGTIAVCSAQDNADPRLTEVWEPVPPGVIPGRGQSPPSDAFVLFDGTQLAEWRSVRGGAARWTVRDSCLTVFPGAGDIETLRVFGDVQLHLEFRCPAGGHGRGQGRGQSGVLLQGLYEVQVLDSYGNPTYANGQCGAIYKQSIPLVNACRPPGEWQSFDIVFLAPRFTDGGSILSPAFITVFQNGVLVQNHAEIQGGTVDRGGPKYELHPLKMPLRLQEHGSPVGYRNIWVREL